MAERKSEFALPTLDDLFSTQQEREAAKLEKMRNIPFDLIDDFPDHPFHVRDAAFYALSSENYPHKYKSNFYQELLRK